MEARSNKITPLVLLGPFFRTGSTLVMEILSTSPRIAMTRYYPYEYNYLTYLWQTSKVISSTTEPNAKWDSTVIQNEKTDVLQPYPFYQQIASRMFEYFPKVDKKAIQCLYFKGLWEVMSDLIRRQSKEAGSDVVYYSEKMQCWAYEWISKLIPAKAILMLRDPRDVYVSALHWLRRHAEIEPNHAGKREPKTNEIIIDIEEATNWIVDYKQRLQYIQAAMEHQDKFVIRYEELVTERETAVAKLQEWLQIELYPEKARSHHLRIHATSRSPLASIGRWHQELPAEVQAIFIRHLSEEMVVLGYDI